MNHTITTSSATTETGTIDMTAEERRLGRYSRFVGQTVETTHGPRICKSVDVYDDDEPIYVTLYPAGPRAASPTLDRMMRDERKAAAHDAFLAGHDA